MKKIISICISLVLILGIVLVLRNQKTTPVETNTVIQGMTQNNANTQDTTQYSSTPTPSSTDTSASSNVTIKDGVQYITIDVKHGYSPRSTIAQGGIPTKIIAKTHESYGCETSLMIRSANYQAYLPPS